MNNNGFVYKGYYYDVETQLYWVSSRYYLPEWGRWISPDDIEYLDPESVNGLNLYCYCGNDPINKIDPTGHFWVLLGAIAIGALIGLGFNAYDQLSKNGWDFSELNIGELAQSAIVGGALGLSFAMGVGYLGPLMSGAITLTNVAYAAGGLAASTVISYCSGTIGYAVNETLNGRDYDFNSASNYGKNVAGESIFRYINGGLIGSFGNIGTKGSMFVTAEWWQKTVLGTLANELTKRMPRGGLLPTLNF